MARGLLADCRSYGLGNLTVSELVVSDRNLFQEESVAVLVSRRELAVSDVVSPSAVTPVPTPAVLNVGDEGGDGSSPIA